jgi:DNA repair exonuclease SbcCD ATPase subunit
VRAPLLDRLVNQAGEVSIARTRIETEVNHIKGSLSDLTDNLERLRAQLRDIELQAETQMSSRIEAAKVASQTFDPLEFDRFTRFQEVTRMMAESVNDVATVQRTLQRAVESTEDELAAQTRLTRDLQDDLLRTRMVEFESQADRLYRVVRQAAKYATLGGGHRWRAMATLALSGAGVAEVLKYQPEAGAQRHRIAGAAWQAGHANPARRGACSTTTSSARRLRRSCDGWCPCVPDAR